MMTEAYDWVLIMGVSGAGKSTIGSLLADRIGAVFLDADDFHPAANLEKMTNGVPLNDEDRDQWLDILKTEIGNRGGHRKLVVACSALKSAYRRKLESDRMRLVYLKGSPGEIAERLAGRKDHFMGAGLLDSQFQDLEEPDDAITVSVSNTPDEIVGFILKRL